MTTADFPTLQLGAYRLHPDQARTYRRWAAASGMLGTGCDCNIELASDGCVADIITPFADPVTDAAPWVSASVAASAQFLGVFITAIDGLDDPVSTRNVINRVGGGGTVGSVAYGARGLRIRGLLLATGEPGMQWGKRWWTRMWERPQDWSGAGTCGSSRISVRPKCSTGWVDLFDVGAPQPPVWTDVLCCGQVLEFTLDITAGNPWVFDQITTTLVTEAAVGTSAGALCQSCGAAVIGGGFEDAAESCPNCAVCPTITDPLADPTVTVPAVTLITAPRFDGNGKPICGPGSGGYQSGVEVPWTDTAGRPSSGPGSGNYLVTSKEIPLFDWVGRPSCGTGSSGYLDEQVLYDTSARPSCGPGSANYSIASPVYDTLGRPSCGSGSANYRKETAVYDYAGVPSCGSGSATWEACPSSPLLGYSTGAGYRAGVASDANLGVVGRGRTTDSLIVPVEDPYPLVSMGGSATPQTTALLHGGTSLRTFRVRASLLPFMRPLFFGFYSLNVTATVTYSDYTTTTHGAGSPVSQILPAVSVEYATGAVTSGYLAPPPILPCSLVTLTFSLAVSEPTGANVSWEFLFMLHYAGPMVSASSGPNGGVDKVCAAGPNGGVDKVCASPNGGVDRACTLGPYSGDRPCLPCAPSADGSLLLPCDTCVDGPLGGVDRPIIGQCVSTTELPPGSFTGGWVTPAAGFLPSNAVSYPGAVDCVLPLVTTGDASVMSGFTVTNGVAAFTLGVDTSQVCDDSVLLAVRLRAKFTVPVQPGTPLVGWPGWSLFAANRVTGVNYDGGPLFTTVPPTLDADGYMSKALFVTSMSDLRNMVIMGQLSAPTGGTPGTLQHVYVEAQYIGGPACIDCGPNGGVDRECLTDAALWDVDTPLVRCWSTTPPINADSVPVITIHSGSTPLRNAEIVIYANPTAFPCPSESVAASQAWACVTPLATGRIKYLPANTKLVIDGRARTITASTVETYVQFPGTVDNWLSTPAAAELAITGDIEMVTRYRHDAVGFDHGVLSTAEGTDLQVASLVSYPAIPGLDLPYGETRWLRVRRVAATGVITVDTAPDQATEPATWTFEGSATSTPGPLDGDGLGISAGMGTGDNMRGRLYRAIVRAGIAGSTVFDFAPSGDNSFTWMVAATGQVVKVNRSATGTKTAVVTTGATVDASDLVRTREGRLWAWPTLTGQTCVCVTTEGCSTAPDAAVTVTAATRAQT